MMYITSAAKPSLQDAGVAGLKEISVKTDDGLVLFGWHKAPYPPSKPTIVWFHGNASNVGITTWRALPYLKQGYGLLAVEYRGYAGNPGAPTEQGLYKDGRAFIEWLKAEGVAENNIIVYGESIGSGPAVQMAKEYPSLHTLILESPLTSTMDAAAFHYPYIPVKWLIKDRYENIPKIKDIKSPLILIYGDRDRVIPHRLGEALFKAAPEPKSLIVIEGGDHNNLDDFHVADKIISLLSE
ncbi:MAG TPA: alpha/beta hydrolase [Micavibrio sp.]|nr:alpha/beta hydrolase [Micavibrio sp.]